MNSGLYTGFSGLSAQMNALEMLANNLANLNTPGFKEQKAFYTLLNRTADSLDARELNATINNHSVLAQGVLNLNEGSMVTTNRTLDVALEGNGFLVVRAPGGERYTRNGSLSLNDKSVLSTQDGLPVLGEDGTIELGPGEIRISDAGAISVNGVAVDRLKLVTFDNPLTLQKEGNSLFLPGKDSGSPKSTPGIKIRQGSLEQSNVNPVAATVQMIGVLRQFEAMQKGINLLMHDVNSKSIERLSR